MVMIMLKWRPMLKEQDLRIRPLEEADISAAKAFTDRAIGENYYSIEELADVLRRSKKDGRVCSLVLVGERGEILGLRITFPPGQWNCGKGKGLTPEKWKVPLQDTAYFQSLFIDPELSGEGWGKKLSLESLKILSALGSRAVVCHSWKESPHDSSGRYLRGLGFELINVHPLYWHEVDYVCTRCGKPCVCTAEEMIKYL